MDPEWPSTADGTRNYYRRAKKALGIDRDCACVFPSPPPRRHGTLRLRAPGGCMAIRPPYHESWHRGDVSTGSSTCAASSRRSFRRCTPWSCSWRSSSSRCTWFSRTGGLPSSERPSSPGGDGFSGVVVLPPGYLRPSDARGSEAHTAGTTYGSSTSSLSSTASGTSS